MPSETLESESHLPMPVIGKCTVSIWTGLNIALAGREGELRPPISCMLGEAHLTAALFLVLIPGAYLLLMQGTAVLARLTHRNGYFAQERGPLRHDLGHPRDARNGRTRP